MVSGGQYGNNLPIDHKKCELCLNLCPNGCILLAHERGGRSHTRRWTISRNQERDMPSALSHNDFRVNRFQFDPCVADFELPVHAALSGVAPLVPGDRLRA